MAKKKVEKPSNSEVINKLEEKLNETSNDIVINNNDNNEDAENKNDSKLNDIINEVNELKENTIDPLLNQIDQNTLVNNEDTQKLIDDTIKAAEQVEAKLIEEIAKNEPKIKNNYTNVWNGSYGYDIY
jgi:hypothetical protein